VIGSLRGVLLDRSADDELLIEVGGIGYRVQVTAAASVGIGAVNDEVFLFIHRAVREDSDTLYGFESASERRVFEILISAHGVGPALGLAILGVHGPDALRRAVADEDVAALNSKLGVAGDPGSVPSPTGAQSAGSAARSDVRAALEGLGYGADEIVAVLSDVDPDGDSGVLLKEALRRLAVAKT
jgi:Holliday junction DNA helicase RuvA